MSNTKNAIELHLKSLETLQEMRLLEIQLKVADNVNDSMATFGKTTHDDYFDITEPLKESIETKRRIYLQQNGLLKNLMTK